MPKTSSAVLFLSMLTIVGLSSISSIPLVGSTMVMHKFCNDHYHYCYCYCYCLLKCTVLWHWHIHILKGLLQPTSWEFPLLVPLWFALLEIATSFYMITYILLLCIVYKHMDIELYWSLTFHQWSFLYLKWYNLIICTSHFLPWFLSLASYTIPVCQVPKIDQHMLV